MTSDNTERLIPLKQVLLHITVPKRRVTSCHTGPPGEAPDASQQAEGVKGKCGADLYSGFRRRNEQSKVGEFKQV